jgi:hypothetical protein
MLKGVAAGIGYVERIRGGKETKQEIPDLLS